MSLKVIDILGKCRSFVLVFILITGVYAFPVSGQAYDLYLSTTADRSGAVLLEGATVSGNIYVFVSPESGISRVDFYIDDPQMSGSPYKVEGLLPYDMAGTADNIAIALPFNSAGLSDGQHQVTARVVLSTGGSQTIGAAFSVANSTPQLVLSPSVLSFSVPEGGNAAAQSIALTTGNNSAASYTISDNAAWLAVTPVSGFTPGTLSVTVDAAGLSAGTYTGTITAAAGGYAGATASVTLTVTGGSSQYNLLLSTTADRSGAVLLEGATVSGNIYVFVSPESGISRVDFYIDDPQMSGSPYKVEGLLPYDMAGTADNIAIALPFNSAGLSDGQHQVTARVVLSTGGSQTIGAAFSVANSTPQLVLSPSVLSFSVPEGGNAAAQSIALTTGNNSAASYTISDNAAWLAVTPVSGFTPGTLSVTVDAAGLSAGTYTGTITAAAGGYAGATASVTLTVTGGSSQYNLLLSTTADRSGAVLLEGATVSGNIYVFVSPESGISRVDFYIDDPQMSGSPYKVEGLLPYDMAGTADNIAIALPFNSAGLSDGLHRVTARVVLSTGGSQTIGAAFSVANSTPQLVLSPSVLSFSVPEGGNAAAQSIALTTGNNSAASYTISDNAAWLAVTPVSGSTPGTLSVTVDAAGLSAGTYTGTITAAAGGYAGATASVTLTVTGGSSQYNLLLSTAADRSGAVLLEDATVSGNIYVFVSPESGISRVDFYIDDPQMSGSPYKVEGLLPYDMAGTADNIAIALPFNSAGLSDGLHRVTARVVLSSGGSQSITSSFYVSNGSITLPYYEDFQDSVANGWTVVDDSGFNSNWTVTGGEYYQRNFVGRTGSALQGNYHLGTFAYLQSGIGLTDYRITVDAMPLTGADVAQDVQGNDIGIMFRYLDKNNYYRFSLNANQGYSRLEKKAGGVFTTLASDARGYIAEEWLNVEIVVKGPVIQVFLFGDPLFGAYDQTIVSGTIGLYCQDNSKFDNVAIEEIPAEPLVTIAVPTAYSAGLPNDLLVSAVATDLPSFGTIEFYKDGFACSDVVEAFDGLFQAQCSDLGVGDHILEAVLADGTTVYAVDTNMKVGVGGNYLIAMGDSITNGKTDNFASDNWSSDDRVLAVQGYQAVLNDLLTATLAVPHIIYNEGVPGDESYDAAFERIDSVLERHAGANHALVLLGTNDAGRLLPVPSGLDCADCEDSFKFNIQVLIDKLTAAGMSATIAYIPPVFNADGTPNITKNEEIEQYNQVIDAYDSYPLQGHLKGPDFYSFFLTQVGNGASLYADELHPNGLGITLMAHLWHNSMVSATTLPLFLRDLLPLSYKQELIEVDDKIYLDPDNSWVVTQIPASLTSGIWIKTANADRTNTSSNYISFNVDRNVVVNIAYDASVTPPSWLNPETSSFVATGLQVATTGGVMQIYSRAYADFETPIVLPGNHAGDGTGNMNYIVIIQEQ